MAMSLARRAAAEFVGSTLLLATVVGSGVMGERLAAGNLAIALLANSLATGAVLLVLIAIFAPLSGAHLNPAVSAVVCARGELAWRHLPAYVLAQTVGAFAGVWLAHAMFGLAVFEVGTHARSSPGEILGEAVATFGLLLTILGAVRTRPSWTPLLVAAYIVAAYWFTSSTSFANPAVTLARAATDTFAGIAPASVPGFLLAQAAGAMLAAGLDTWLWRAPANGFAKT